MIKKTKASVSIFIILLVLTLPIYSASSLAANVRVTHSSGLGDIENYLDGNGDTWSVEAIVEEPLTPNIDPEQVLLNVNGIETSFDTCQSSALGVVCSFTDLPSRGSGDLDKAFHVEYHFTNENGLPDDVSSNPRIIHSDATAPELTGLSARQSEGDIVVGFDVEDLPRGAERAVGLKRVEIIDVETGLVLQTIPFEGRTTTYSHNGVLPAGLISGEGTTNLKIRALDRLDHSITSAAIPLSFDVTAPSLINISFTSLGTFIGETSRRSEMVVYIEEGSLLGPVRAFSDQTSLNGDSVACEAEFDKLWKCTWPDVLVEPVASLTVRFSAEDQFGNSFAPGLDTLSTPFTIDDSPPVVLFFGSERNFDGANFIPRGVESKLRLVVQEQGSGINQNNIKLDLTGFASAHSPDNGNARPERCESEGSKLICEWDVHFSGAQDSVRIPLDLKDRVGNIAIFSEGSSPELDLHIDGVAPTVEEVGFFGISQAGVKDYFQSRDTLRIDLKVREAHGLLIRVDLHDLLTNADDKFPENLLNKEAGFFAITQEEACNREEGFWLCSFEIPEAIRSGPDSSVAVTLDVQDTASNKATIFPLIAENDNGRSSSRGAYRIELLGLDEDEINPDFWSHDRARSTMDFVDLEVVEFTNVRIPFTIPLSTTSDAVLLSVDLLSCSPADLPISSASEEDIAVEAPPVTRSLFTGTASESPMIIFEFDNFNGPEFFQVDERDEFSTIDVPYNCQLQIFSRIGNSALRSPEIEEVIVKVPFGFSKIGSKDENIDARINEIKDEVFFKIPDKLRYFADIIKIVRTFSSVLDILNGMRVLWGVVMETGDGWRNALPVYGSAIATGTCIPAEGAARPGIDFIINDLNPILQILNCNPSSENSIIGDTFYGQLQNTVLVSYNTWKEAGINQLALDGDTPIFNSKSLYDNIWTSAAGFCIPGVIYNLEKYRQTRCFEMKCLTDSVPAGVSTVESCKRVGEVLQCKYVLGELVGTIMPGTALFEAVKTFITNLLRSPLVVIRGSITLTCSTLCPTSGTAANACDFLGTGVVLFDMINNIIGLIDRIPQVTYDLCNEFEDDIF